MVLFSLDAWVWLSHGEDAWIPVKMVSQKGDRILAKAATGEQYELDVSQDYDEVHPSSLRAVENMVDMEHLSEAAILHNLRLRFSDHLIYSSIGSILVSINPFAQLPLYGPAIMKEYRTKMSRMQPCAPHVYSLAYTAFKNLRENNENQSVIISGESGAGKTEATKLVLQFLAEMSGQGNDVEQQLLSSNPIVEAFGNAKTVRNNNSSRFGKFISIRFDDRFKIVGADIANYLLEKSRVVLPSKGERNYHVFYQLCAGASPSEREKWHLSDASKFRSLSVGHTLEVDGMDDAEEYRSLRAALDTLEFAPSEVEEVMRCCSAVLHIGNFDFSADSKDGAVLQSQAELDIVAQLLRVDSKALSTALVSQRKQMGRESILTVRSVAQAEASRDALAKKLYDSLFNRLVQRVNKTLGAKSAGATRFVGVLDIFGFESFEVNRLEQLMINFANEKMQQHFNACIFQMEQAEYAAEAIDVASVDFVDNGPCLALIEEGRGSILSMFDEELKLPGGGDENLLARLHAAHQSNSYYIKPKQALSQFGIRHYAGPVSYSVESLCDKNRDALESNIAEVVQGSSSPFVADLIPQESGSRTLGSQFKAQLAALMDTLNSTAPHFIRTIKSNDLKVADVFDSQLVLRQLRYLGLKEVVRIRQSGFPVRRAHADFVKRYGLLGTGPLSPTNCGGMDPAARARALLQAFPGASDAEWRVGKSKTFLRQSLSTALEGAREGRLTRVATFLQSLARTRLWRRRFLALKGAVARLKQLMDDEAATAEALDEAISAYERLRFKTDAALIQKALRIRNRRFEQAQAKRAVESALRSGELEALRTAHNKKE